MSNNNNVSIDNCYFQLLDSVIDTNSAAYVAGPLDSGKKYYESLAGKIICCNIREENQNNLTSFARALRKKLNYPVIDPGILKIDGWSGSEYSIFFIEVINRYAKEVWFLEGWEYSSGATKEFVYCQKNSIPCLDSYGSTLSMGAGKLLIDDAVCYINYLGLDSSKLRSRLNLY